MRDVAVIIHLWSLAGPPHYASTTTVSLLLGLGLGACLQGLTAVALVAFQRCPLSQPMRDMLLRKGRVVSALAVHQSILSPVMGRV